MEINDIKFCPTHTGLYLGKILKNGDISSERRVVNNSEMEDVVTYYGNKNLKIGEARAFGLSDGTKIIISHING